MRFISSHSRHLLTVAIIVGYMYLPVAYWFWLVTELEAGAFPVDADSLGIPMAGFLFLWALMPILIGGRPGRWRVSL